MSVSDRKKDMRARIRARSKAAAGTDFTEAKPVKDGCVWYVSLDMGKKNFAFLVEEFRVDTLTALRDRPVMKRIAAAKKGGYTGYGDNGVPCDDLKEVLNEVCMNGRTILHKVVDLTTGSAPGKSLDHVVLHNMNDLLSKYSFLHSTYSVGDFLDAFQNFHSRSSPRNSSQHWQKAGLHAQSAVRWP